VGSFETNHAERGQPMYRIVASIISLQQHLDSLANNPVIYRPRVCPHCSFGQLWCHGCYERKADRQQDDRFLAKKED